MDQNKGVSPPPWYRQFWPWFIISIPLGTIVAAMFTINIAFKTDDGLVTEDYYKKGLAIHRNADALEKARQLGVQAEVDLSGDKKTLLLRVTSESNQAFGKLQIALRHPTLPNQDMEALMQPVGPDNYRGELPEPLQPIRWIIELKAPESGWALRGRFNPKTGQAVVLR